MNSTLAIYKNRNTKILLTVLVLGIVVALFPIVLPAKECPDTDIFGNCIIGANIGGGLMIFSGIFIALIAVVGLLAKILASISSHRSKKLMYITSLAIISGLCLLAIGVIAAPLKNRAEVEKLNNCITINMVTGETTYPPGKNNSNFSQSKNCNNLKGAPGAKINYAYAKVFSGIMLFLAGCLGVGTVIKSRKT